jgi:hypothetical protein
MGNRPRGSPRSRITMPNVRNTIMMFLDTLRTLPYLPGWRGGRRDIGTPRPNCCLLEPTFAPGFDDLPPDDWLFLDMPSSLFAARAGASAFDSARGNRGESKRPRALAQRPRPWYRWFGSITLATRRP